MGNALPQGIVEAFDVVGFLNFLRHGFVPLRRNLPFVCLILIGMECWPTALSRCHDCDRRWGGGGMGILAIVRFPMDARHPVAQKPYGAYAVGEVFPFTYQGQLYHGRVIERLVSRADGLV